MKECIKESPALVHILLHLLTPYLHCADLKQILLEAFNAIQLPSVNSMCSK